MNRFEILDNLVNRGNGYLRTAQVLECGISKPTLADYVRSRRMTRIARGVYISEEAWTDELYILHLTNGGIIYSHETSLMLHGFMEREPICTEVTVRAGYNASHLRNRGITVHQVKPDIYELGVELVQTSFGNFVPSYNMERTICDVIRHKESMDVQIFQYAIKEYMTSSSKNLHLLMDYAKTFNIESIVRTYTEVML